MGGAAEIAAVKQDGGSDARRVSLSFVAKLASAPLVAGGWFLATYWVLDAIGIAGFATFSIIAGLAAVLPFLDLGLGVAAMDAAANQRADLLDVIGTTTWLLGRVASGVLVLATVGWASGVFPPLLGVETPASTSLAVWLALVIFALSLPLNVGPRLLTGLGLNHWMVGFQTLAVVVMLAQVFVAKTLGGGLPVFAMAPFVGVLVSNLLASRVAAARIGTSLSSIARLVVKRKFRRVSVAGVAGPTFVIMLVLPVAYQLDRIMLAHVSGSADVAEYGVLYQLFGPMLGLVGTAAMVLWPIFAGARTSGKMTFARWQRAFLLFATGGLVASAAFVVIARPISGLISGGGVEVGWPLVCAFAVLLLVQTVQYPAAMYLTTPQGLVFQAWLHIGMVALNVPLSLHLAEEWGASGPVWASVVTVLPILTVPMIIRTVHQLKAFTSSCGDDGSRPPLVGPT